MTSVRVDKWLWSVRIYKTRTKASTACRDSKVSINGHTLKPSAHLKGGEILTVKKNGFHFQFEVIQLIGKRVGAPIAVTCYENRTPQEELNKYEAWFSHKRQSERRDKGLGRPTKKERRQLDEFKTWDWDEEED